jgi:hypothetical protein
MSIARVTNVADYKKYARIDVVFLDHGQPCPVWVINNLDREPVEGDQVLIGFIEGRQDAPYVVGFVKNKSYTTNFVVVDRDKVKLQLPIFDIGVEDGKSAKDVSENLLDNEKQPERAYIEMTPEDGVLVSFPTDGEAPNRPAFIRLESTRAVVAFPTDNTEDAPNVYLELKNDYALLNFPTSPDGSTPPIYLKIDANGISLNGDIALNGKVTVTGDMEVSGKLDVGGEATLSGAVTLGGGTQGVAREGDSIEVDVAGTTYAGVITSGSSNVKG